MARARSCPSCHSIGPPAKLAAGLLCNDIWHRPPRETVIAPSPSKPRPADPLARELADGLRMTAHNYQREGSGPDSLFEGRTLEDVQTEWVLRELARTGHGEPVPAQMTVSDMGEGLDVVCREHGVVLTTGEISLRTLMFEARRHWREQHS